MRLFNLLKFYKTLKCINTTKSNKQIKTSQARGTVVLGEKIFNAMKENGWGKSAIFSRAQLAGINGARKTSELIPSLQHQALVESVGIRADLDERTKTVILTSTVKSPSDYNMDTEAMTAVAIAALTIYDMAKKYNQDIYIRDIELLHKSSNCTEGQTRDAKDTIEVRAYDKTPITDEKPVVVEYI